KPKRRTTMNVNKPKLSTLLIGSARQRAGLLVVGFLLALSSALWACDPQKKDGKIKVTVVVILASERPGEVDPRLKGIADEVNKKDPALKSFQMQSMSCLSLPANKEASFKLVEDQVAQVVIHHGADAENRVSLAVTAPRQGEIVYRTVCGKFLPIITR